MGESPAPLVRPSANSGWAPPRGRASLRDNAPAFDSPRTVLKHCAHPLAGWENRTPNYSLENCRFTTKLIPRSCRSVARFRSLFISCRIVYARRMRRGLFNVIALSIFAIGLFLFSQYQQKDFVTSLFSNSQKQLSAANASEEYTPALVQSTTTATAATSTAAVSIHKKPSVTATVSTSTPTNEIARVQNPYPTPPESFDEINTSARSALVNILCAPQGGSLLPVSGSGVIIDPRGIILTNAHVAQYVLLSESPSVDLSCEIRDGSPAKAQWKAVVLYIPPVWVDQHASEILDQHPAGTGEHDYAFLYIVGSVDGTPLPSQFPYVSPETREAIAFPGDQVLVASYPAEFIGGAAAEYDLYAVSSVTTIKQFLTFASGTPDLLSLGGIIEAQSGSSGGAVVNAWNRLVGIIATTSTGTTTADRDLRAVALSYINADLAKQSGQDLNSLLSGDPISETLNFNNTLANTLINEYIPVLSHDQ